MSTPFRSSSALALLAAVLLLPAAAGQGLRQRTSARPTGRPNLLVVLLDDVGLDLVDFSGVAPGTPACTPTLDALAAGGLLFRHAWTNPICSPTRAQVLTGRHGFRTGVGKAVNGGDPTCGQGLQPDALTIAEVVQAQGYSTGLFGKWHLATNNHDPRDPLTQGFDWFEGVLAGSLDSLEKTGCPTCPPGCKTGELNYEHWVKDTNGISTCETGYATTVNVDDALAAVGTVLPEPWLVFMNFNAVHDPFHTPPPALCPGLGTCFCSGPLTTDAEKVKAALEALDTELGRLLAGLHAQSSQPTYVFLLGDNGTAGPVAQGAAGSCFDPFRSKSTVFESGIAVPFVVAGPGVEPAELDALVSSADLFDTLAELAGAPDRAEDSVSLVPYLFGFRGSLRSTIYAERFTPNGLPFAPTDHRRAIRDARYKLIRRTGQPDLLFDLEQDPCETIDLSGAPPTSPAGKAFLRLDHELRGLGVG